MWVSTSANNVGIVIRNFNNHQYDDASRWWGSAPAGPAEAPAPRDLVSSVLLAQMHKFNVLLTSYGMVRDEPELFRSVPWRVMIVDEAHRLKNKDSAMAADLRALKPEHTVMLTGTPLQVCTQAHSEPL